MSIAIVQEVYANNYLDNLANFIPHLKDINACSSTPQVACASWLNEVVSIFMPQVLATPGGWAWLFSWLTTGLMVPTWLSLWVARITTVWDWLLMPSQRSVKLVVQAIILCIMIHSLNSVFYQIAGAFSQAYLLFFISVYMLSTNRRACKTGRPGNKALCIGHTCTSSAK